MLKAFIFLVAALQLQQLALALTTTRQPPQPETTPYEVEEGGDTTPPPPQEVVTPGFPTNTPTQRPQPETTIRPEPPIAKIPTAQTCKVDYDTDYYGCDIGASIRPSWQECAEACKRHRGCAYWVFDPNMKKCHYKNKRCNIRTKKDVVSGNRACGESCKVDYGTDYTGCNIGSSTEGSWQECAKRCSKTPNCNYWTWTHRMASGDKLKCQLKDKQCNIRTGEANHISGNRACAVADDHRCTPYYGKDWQCGNVFKKECNIFKWQACAEMCNRDSRCGYWTWFHPRSNIPNNCWLRRGGNCRLVNKANTLAGERYCRGQGTARYA